ncbi:MAG TPA: hypothetical protein VF744_05755 [Beijerinckiaceae bacterium]|jgi:hypothetical protein
MAQSPADPLALPAAPEPSVRPRKRPPLFRLRTALGAAAAVLCLALLAREGGPEEAPAPRRVAPAVLVAPPAQWQPLPDAKPRFTVDAPELKALPRGFGARLRAGGGREDKIVHGTFESEDAYLRLAVFRGPAEAERSFFIDLARRAGEAGLGILRTGRPSSIATKLGTLETTEAVLADAFARPCRAFRLRHEAGLSLHGWHCAAGGPTVGEAPAPAETACLIDRIALLPAAEDADLRALFGQAEKRRESCPPRPQEAKRRSS